MRGLQQGFGLVVPEVVPSLRAAAGPRCAHCGEGGYATCRTCGEYVCGMCLSAHERDEHGQ